MKKKCAIQELWETQMIEAYLDVGFIYMPSGEPLHEYARGNGWTCNNTNSPIAYCLEGKWGLVSVQTSRIISPPIFNTLEEAESYHGKPEE